MPIELWIVVGFVTLVVIMAIAWKGSTLESLAPLPDESVAFDEEGIEVTHHARPSRRPTTRLPFVHVRLTNRRLIVSQKALIGGKRVLRYIVIFGEISEDPGLGGAFKTGYVSAVCPAAKIVIDADDQGRDRVSIPLLGGAIIGEQSLSIITKRRDDYEKHFAQEA